MEILLDPFNGIMFFFSVRASVCSLFRSSVLPSGRSSVPVHVKVIMIKGLVKVVLMKLTSNQLKRITHAPYDMLYQIFYPNFTVHCT